VDSVPAAGSRTTVNERLKEKSQRRTFLAFEFQAQSSRAYSDYWYYVVVVRDVKFSLTLILGPVFLAIG